MVNQNETAAVLKKIADTFQYATTIVGMGTHPDDPDRVFAQIVTIPGAHPICLLKQAAMLRSMADEVDEAHKQGRCSA